MILTKEQYEHIEDALDVFKITTDYHYHDFGWDDILYTIFNSNKETLSIKYDWDEGRNNEPIWDDTVDMHYVISFLHKVKNYIDDKTPML